MTAREMSNVLGISEYTLRNQFHRTNEHLKEKWGIYLVREGFGEYTEYYIEELYEGCFLKFRNRYRDRILSKKSKSKKNQQ